MGHVNELVVLAVVLVLLWVGYRAIFRWLDVREQARIWGPVRGSKSSRDKARR